MGDSAESEHFITRDELAELTLEVSHTLAERLLGGKAMELYALPIAPVADSRL